MMVHTTRRKALELTAALLAAVGIGTGTAVAESSRGARIILGGTVSPGESVTVTVIYDGSAPANAEVDVDGGGSGVTDAAGQAVVTLPTLTHLDEEGLSVEFEADDPDRRGSASIEDAALDAVLETTTTITSSSSISGELEPGDEVSLTASIDGTPLADADVEVDSEEVAATDPKGHAEGVDVVEDGEFEVRVDNDTRRVEYGVRWD